MAFIQVEQSLVTHRKTLRLARLLHIDRYAVVGRLVALWSWCLDNAPDGCLGEGVGSVILADVVGRDGNPDELAEALISVGFLDVAVGADDTRPHLHIHDWQDWASRPALAALAAGVRVSRDDDHDDHDDEV